MGWKRYLVALQWDPCFLSTMMAILQVLLTADSACLSQLKNVLWKQEETEVELAYVRSLQCIGDDDF